MGPIATAGWAGRTLLLVLLAAGPTRAEPPPGGSAAAGASDPGRAARAHDLFQRGMASFAVDRYDEAIAAFQAGFLLDPRPELLFNIAQAERKAHRKAQAVEYYQRYLDLRPAAPDRAQVERSIAELRAPPPPAPIYRRWWLWTTVVGVLVAAAAVALGVALGVSRYPDTTLGFMPVGP